MLSNNFKKDCVIIVDTWCETLEQNKLLLECLSNLDTLNVDICLVSHHPVSSDIQRLVSYYVYDKHNELLQKTTGEGWWFGNDDFNIILNGYNNGLWAHSPAVLSSLKNSFSLSKAVDKKYAFWLDADTIVDIKDLHSFRDVYDETVSNNKKAWFENDTRRNPNKQMKWVNCDFFFGEIDFILNNIKFKSDIPYPSDKPFEVYLYDCLVSVIDDVIIHTTENGLTLSDQFPNSNINTINKRPITHSKHINTKNKNYHLMSDIVFKENTELPVMYIINNIPNDALMGNSKQGNRNLKTTKYIDAVSNLEIFYYVNGEQQFKRTLTIDSPNQWYIEALHPIKNNKHKLEIKIFNTSSLTWDNFYLNEWDESNIEEIKNNGYFKNKKEINNNSHIELPKLRKINNE